MKSIYEQVVEMLKKNKEVELYRFVFTESGKLDFYIDKVYKAEDGEKITRKTTLASVMGVKYRLDKIKCIGTAVVRGESFLVKENPNDYNEPIETLYFGDINEYSFSITEAIKRVAKLNPNRWIDKREIHFAFDESTLYFLGKDGSLLGFRNEAKNKDDIELLLSKGLISKLED